MSLETQYLYTIGTVLSGLCFIICTLICSAIIFSRKTRRKSFNLYVVALIVPDIIVNLVSLVVNIIELSEDEHVESLSHGTCVFIASVSGYYIYTNLWTSALICYEVYWLLKKSSSAERYKPTEVKVVLLRVVALHVSAVLGAVIIYVLLPLVGIDITENPCLGTQQEETFIITMILVLITILPPLLYICYVTVDVYKRNLLPPAGKSRFVATFFIRTVLLTIIFTLALASTLTLRKRAASKAFDFLRSGQGIVIAGMSLMKPDIQKTTLHFVTCGMFREKVSGPNINAHRSLDPRSISTFFRNFF